MTLAAIGIVSADIPRTLAFYKLLGLELVRHGNSEHYAATTTSGVQLMVDSVDLIKSLDGQDSLPAVSGAEGGRGGVEPAFEKKTSTGLALCFRQSSPAAVDYVYGRITKAGYASIKAPFDAVWGQRYACVADPDGNQIDLFAPTAT